MTGHDKALRIYQFVLIACVAIAVYVVMVEKARGHSFYDPWCCSGSDCADIPAKAVKAVAGGYLVTLVPGDHHMVTKPHTFLIPHDKRRDSPDGLYHICLYPTENDMRCFYAPSMGS